MIRSETLSWCWTWMKAWFVPRWWYTRDILVCTSHGTWHTVRVTVVYRTSTIMMFHVNQYIACNLHNHDDFSRSSLIPVYDSDAMMYPASLAWWGHWQWHGCSMRALALAYSGRLVFRLGTCQSGLDSEIYTGITFKLWKIIGPGAISSILVHYYYDDVLPGMYHSRWSRRIRGPVL